MFCFFHLWRYRFHEHHSWSKHKNGRIRKSPKCMSDLEWAFRGRQFVSNGFYVLFVEDNINICKYRCMYIYIYMCIDKNNMWSHKKYYYLSKKHPLCLHFFSTSKSCVDMWPPISLLGDEGTSPPGNLTWLDHYAAAKNKQEKPLATSDLRRSKPNTRPADFRNIVVFS